MNPKKIHESMQKKLKNALPDEDSTDTTPGLSFKIGYWLAILTIWVLSWLIWNHFAWKFGLPTLNLGQFMAFSWSVSFLARIIRGSGA